MGVLRIITDLPDSFCPVTMPRMSINGPQAPWIIYAAICKGLETRRTVVSAELQHEIFLLTVTQ
jgi:hypothetical protein